MKADVLTTFHRGDLRFDVRDTGPAGATAKDTVVLLHGFPQDSTAWSLVTPRLVDGGLRVLAPDLRGYSPGARPRERSAYRLSELVGDVVTLLEASNITSAHVVGHDWGGGLAWALGALTPERVRSLTVLSTPHPAAMEWATRHSTQGLRSWYMLAMQVPVLPEHLLARSIAKGALARLGLPAEHASAYAARFSDPTALAGAIAWYRGLFSRRGSSHRSGRGTSRASQPPAGGNLHALSRRRVSDPIPLPTTYVWGRHDPYLGAPAAQRTARYCTGDYRFIDLDDDHWLPEKHPDAVADAVLDRVRSTASS